MGQHIQCSWDGFIAVHRYEDLTLIRETIEMVKPQWAVELGTAEGGFAAFLATILGQWDGKVYTFDFKLDPGIAQALHQRYPNLWCIKSDVLDPDNQDLIQLLNQRNGLLYTDNGNKQRELEIWAMYLPEPAMIGSHDYGTELNSEWAEQHMKNLGFKEFRHAEFAKLAHDTDYPVSLTRFWTKTSNQSRRVFNAR